MFRERVRRAGRLRATSASVVGPMFFARKPFRSARGVKSILFHESRIAKEVTARFDANRLFTTIPLATGLVPKIGYRKANAVGSGERATGGVIDCWVRTVHFLGQDKLREFVNELDSVEVEQEPKRHVQRFHVLEQKVTKETKKGITVIYALPLTVKLRGYSGRNSPRPKWQECPSAIGPETGWGARAERARAAGSVLRHPACADAAGKTRNRAFSVHCAVVQILGAQAGVVLLLRLGHC
jgi:hypothetical protein